MNHQCDGARGSQDIPRTTSIQAQSIFLKVIVAKYRALICTLPYNEIQVAIHGGEHIDRNAYFLVRWTI